MSRMNCSIKKIAKVMLLLVFVMTALLSVMLGYSGVWRVFFPSTHHDTLSPPLPTNMTSPAILVFSKTNSFRHASGIDGGNKTLTKISARNNWEIFTTENGAIFNEVDLQRFAAVVFLNTTGDTLNQPQQRAFQHWLETGGGWLGIHGAGDGSHTAWPWYMEHLIGAEFTAHIVGPQFQAANVITETPNHPAVRQLPDLWSHAEEWYSWEQSPRSKGFTILVRVDEASYSPAMKLLGYEKDLSMGDHPVAWSNCVGNGRTLYTALGHNAETFDSIEFGLLLEDSLRWLMGPSGKARLPETHQICPAA